MGSLPLRLSLVILAGCGSGGGFADAPPPDSPPATGTFTLDWSVTDTANQNLSCDRIGGTAVTVLAHNRAVEGGLTQVFTCSTGTGQSQGLAPGVYDFTFELDGAIGVISPNSTEPALVQHGVTITSNENTRLAPIVFAVNATGGLALTLDSGKSGGNCGAVGSGGAGITATTITLVHNSDSSCEQATIAISGGGTYTVNCMTPFDGPCIETTQVLTASVPSDAYTIHVRGKIGTTACYSNNDGLQVPPDGNVLTRTLNLGYAAGTPGC